MKSVKVSLMLLSAFLLLGISSLETTQTDSPASTPSVQASTGDSDPQKTQPPLPTNSGKIAGPSPTGTQTPAQKTELTQDAKPQSSGGPSKPLEMPVDTSDIKSASISKPIQSHVDQSQTGQKKPDVETPSAQASTNGANNSQKTSASNVDAGEVHTAPMAPLTTEKSSQTTPAKPTNSKAEPIKSIRSNIVPSNVKTAVGSSRLKDLTSALEKKHNKEPAKKDKKSVLGQSIPEALTHFEVPGLESRGVGSLKPKMSSQVKQIESSVYEETAEFKSGNVIRNSKKLELKKIYEANEEWMTFEVSEDYFEMRNKFHLIVMKGSGTLFVRTENKDGSRRKSVKMSLDSSYEMTYIPVNTMFYLAKKGDRLQVKVEKGLLGLLDMPEVKIDLVEYISMEFNQNHRVITKLKEKVPYKVTRPDLHVNTEGKDDRLQFILQSSLNDQELHGDEEISMYINRKEEFPSRSRYDFMATGNMGYGLIKSLHKGNPNYCLKRDCEYFVSIYSKNVDVLFFFPTVFANDSKLTFHRYLYLLEEVEGSEMVTYELDVPVHDGDWAFIIQPIEGYPRMFVNPDEKPKKNEMYKYKSIGEKAETITITAEQSRQYGFSHKKFFVSFSGPGSDDMVASFKFEVKKIMDHQPKFIRLNYAETGVVANKEIVQYKLHFEVDEPELINFEMNLVGVVGKTIMIIKECEKEGSSCKVTPEDVDICKNEMQLDKSYDSAGSAKDLLRNMGDGLPGRLLQQGSPMGQYPQAQNGYNGQGGYYNPYETDYNAPANRNRPNANQNYQYAQQNMQYNPRNVQYAPQNVQNAPLNNGFSQPNPNYQPNYNRPTSNYIPRNNYYPANGGQNGAYQGNPNYNQYYRDVPTDPGQNFNNQDMVNQSDIKQAEQEEQAFINQNSAYNPTPIFDKGGQRNYQLDKNLNPIAPSQENLTSVNAKQLEREIADPVFGTSGQEKLEKIKDKEMDLNRDYATLKHKQRAQQELEAQTTNLDKQFSQSAPALGETTTSQPLPKMKEKPKGYKYDLNYKLKKDKLKCVEAVPEPGSRDFREIALDFNCIGIHNSHKGMSFEQLDNRYPFFNLCQFAVGIYGNNDGTEKFEGSFYSINGKGGNIHTNVAMRKSKEFIVEDGETKYLRFDLKDHSPSPKAIIRAKVVAITGTCKLYFSKFDKFPNPQDNEAKMVFSSEHFMSVRTSEKSVNIPFDTWGAYSSLFVGIRSKEYCVLDFYVEKLNSADGDDGLKNELLKRGKMVKRKITDENFIDSLSSVKKRVYGRSFHFEGDVMTHLLTQETKVIINSTVTGLRLCLQRGNKEFDPEQECDIESHTGVAVIPNLITILDPGIDWAFGVLLDIQDNGMFHTKLPVEFSVVCASGEDSKETLKILNPGRIFESHLTSRDTIIFKVNLLAVEEKSLIVLTSEDKSVKAEISLNQRDFSSPRFVLDADRFAVELNHMEQDIICEKYEEDDSCIFFIRVTTKSTLFTRFSLTYTVDDIPITLKQGAELFVPNKDNMYFLYDPNPLFPAEFNLESEHTQFVVYAKLLSLAQIKKKPLVSLLTEMKFDFKTDIGREEQLRIPQKLIREAGDDVVIAYLVAPKFGRMELESPTIYYESSATTRIHVKSKMSQLSAYVEGRAVLNKGEFRHFYFNVDNAKDFSLIMTVQSGSADLYLNKGLFNLPTLKSYWKRSIGAKGEELAISTDAFDNPDDIKGVYTAGIFAKSNCRVAVVYLPSFDNLIKIKTQKLLNMKLRKNQDYYFEFYNKLPVWDLDIYAENSDLSISIMDYAIQKDKSQDLVDLLKDPSNYFEHFSFVKGSLPLQHREQNAKVNKHYVVKVRATEHDAQLNIMIYEPKKPILVPAKQHFTFVGDKGESYIFKAELTGDYEKVKLNFKLVFGAVDFAFSSDVSDLDKQEKHVLSLPVVKAVEYTPPSKPSDIELFDTFYLKVTLKEFSKFNFIIRGAEKFLEIRPFETEIIHTSNKEDQNVYFYVSKNQLKTTHSMTIDINTVNFYSGKPHFYFNPDGENEIELGSESKFLPMPLDDIQDTVSGEFRHLEIRPEIENGYYIVNIPRSNHHLPVKIALGLNNRRSLEVNGVYRYQLPGSSDPAQKFSMYLPETGEFRFLIESCKKVQITRAELNTYNSSKPIIFQENLVQASHFILYDDSDPAAPKRVYKNFMTRVFRGVNDFTGVLNFSVGSRSLTDKDSKGLASAKKDYLLLTEFKPSHRNLFFKDYLNLWGNSEEENRKQYNYSWSENRKTLRVDLFVPQFHEQLLIDFPDLKKVVIKFFVHVFDDPRFLDRLELCGLAAVEEVPHSRLFHTEVIQASQLKSKKPLAFMFSESHLRRFARSKTLNVFTYMSISFFENELEEFEVGLEMKFANTPYFLFVTKNLYGRSQSYLFSGAIVICVVILVGFVCYLQSQNKMNENDVRRIINKTLTGGQSGYSNPNDPQPGAGNDGFTKIQDTKNKIEMT